MRETALGSRRDLNQIEKTKKHKRQNECCLTADSSKINAVTEQNIWYTHEARSMYLDICENFNHTGKNKNGLLIIKWDNWLSRNTRNHRLQTNFRRSLIPWRYNLICAIPLRSYIFFRNAFFPLSLIQIVEFEVKANEGGDSFLSSITGAQ